MGLAEVTTGLLEGKCALITGGTTGLGLAIAGRFRREGGAVGVQPGRTTPKGRFDAGTTRYG